MSHKPAVIVISSHVARGSVGNRAAVFALEAFSHPVWAVPTIMLPWHPGHGPATRLVHDGDDFERFLEDMANAPWISEVGAILSGYMANAGQVSAVAKLVDSVKAKQPETLYLCDPVIGDVGGLYVLEETASAIRDHLVPRCDMATPNRFELAWLRGSAIPANFGDLKATASKLGPKSVVVTSAVDGDPTETGNLYIDPDTGLAVMHEAISDPPNGPGDLTAATFLAHWLDGLTIAENLQLTTSSVFEILQQSAKRGSDELTLESDVASLLHPARILDVHDL